MAEAPYAESKENPPKCIAFADIRGDFKLLFTLLTQVFEVAKIENGKWQWTVSDTTVVCLGNFTDRFSKKGYNRLTLTTDFAMQDQIRIISTFEELQAASKLENKNNNIVVLMGDHELGNIFKWSHYEIYQMADPANTQDQEQHIEFVNNYLKPFCAQHGIAASWGLPGATVYFSHGSLDKDWFFKLRPDSLIDLNRKWQRWLKHNNFIRLAPFASPNSPIMSTRMAMEPQLWRENDEETILRVLGTDPNPRFIQAGIPIQVLQHETWDPYMRTPKCTKHPKGSTPAMLVSRNADGVDQIYFLHNAMADVFCSYDEEDRRPQGLQFELIMNNSGSALYLQCKSLTMSEDEYRIYLGERPLTSCSAPIEQLDPEDIKLSEDELFHYRPMIDNETLSSIAKETDHIKEVALVLFSDDMKQIYVLQHVLTPTQWAIPRGTRYSGESDWESLERVVREQTGINHLNFMDGGEFVDHFQTRVWIKQTRQAMTFHPNSLFQSGTWIDYQHIWTDKHIFLDRPTKLTLKMLLQSNSIPPVEEADPESIDEWDKKLEKWKLYKAGFRAKAKEKWKQAKKSKILKGVAIGAGGLAIGTAAVLTAPIWGPVALKGLLVSTTGGFLGSGDFYSGDSGGYTGGRYTGIRWWPESSQKPKDKTNEEKEEEEEKKKQTSS